jgi:hypothetical protein
MDDQTTEGTAWLTDRAVTTSDDGPLDHLAVWATAQTDELAALAPALPAAAGAAVSHSLELLDSVSARTDGLQVALTCAAGPAVGSADELGPTPADCIPVAPGAPSEGTGTDTGVPGTGSTDSTEPPTTPAVPTPAVPGGTGSGSTGTDGSPGTGGLPVPGTPTVPGLPIPGTPTIPPVIPGLPSVSLPGAGPSGPVIDLPDDSPVDLCVPPLVC